MKFPAPRRNPRFERKSIAYIQLRAPGWLRNWVWVLKIVIDTVPTQLAHAFQARLRWNYGSSGVDKNSGKASACSESSVRAG
jgi:hypothetical protein